MRKYIVVRMWRVEARNIPQALDKTHNWNHFSSVVEVDKDVCRKSKDR